jgi:hypothetical protein
MTMYKAKLVPELPKEHGNGFAGNLTTELTQLLLADRATRPRVALVVLVGDSAQIKADGTRILALRAAWVQPVTDVVNRRACEEMLRDEYLSQDGALVLPFELDELSHRTFGDLPRTPAQIDEDQARLQESMSATDELKEHLRVVHGVGEAGSFTAAEVESMHDADHADGGAAMAEGMRHEPAWHGWTRADLEQAEIEADEYSDVYADTSFEVGRTGLDVVSGAGGTSGESRAPLDLLSDDPEATDIGSGPDVESENVFHVDFAGGER